MAERLPIFDQTSHGFAEKLLSSLGDGVVAVDTEANVTFLNPVAEELTGWSQADALGQPVETVFRIVNEHSRQTVANPVRQALTTGEAVALANHTLLIRRDGLETPIDDSAAPIERSDGTLDGAVLIFRSIAERRSAEKRLEEDQRIAELTSEVGQAVADEEELSAMTDRVCRALVKRLDAVFARIWTLNEAEQVLELDASAGLYTHLDGSHARVPMGALKIGSIAASGKPHLTNSVVGDAYVDQAWAEQNGLVSFAGYPLKSGKQVLGVIALFARRPLSETTLAAMAGIGRMVASDLVRRRSLHQAESAQEYAEGIVQTVREPLLILDSDFHVRSANRAFYRTFLTSEQATLGRSLFELGDGQWDIPQLRQQLQKTIPKSLSFDDFEVTHDFKVIGQRTMLLNARKLYREGNNTRLILLAIEDVTERRRLERDKSVAETRFRAMVEQVSDYAVFMFDCDGIATTWNEGVKEVLGYDEEDFIGNPIGPMIFTDAAREKGIPEREMQRAEEQGAANDDRWMKRKDGTKFWASGITSAAFDADNNLIGYNKILRDLTERKRTEDAVRRLNAELSANDARKNEFIATLAHELRNPLSPIASAVALLRDCADDPEEVQELRDIAERQVKQLVRLVDDLLDVSRISRGKVELQRSVCRLQDILSDAVASSMGLIEESRHRLSIEQTDQPLYVNGDRARLTQVVTNLLNNAAKYTPTGGDVRLSLTLEGQDAQVVVEDNGIGIPLDRRSHLFDLFSQLEPQSLSGKHGLGVGLALVKQLVELHEGTIEVHSEGEDQGSRFTVRLQICEPPLNGDASSLQEVPTDIQPRRVLVVDDQRAITVTLSRLLQRMGHEVRIAGNGLQALETLESFIPEVVISDVSMPEMNGYELASEIRLRHGQDICLVAMTGYGMQSDRDKAVEAGFDHHMVKPPDAQALDRFFGSL